MTKDIYENRKTFHKALKQFLWTDEPLNLLPGCGWCDGGCRSLMKAFQLWLGEKNVEPYQIVRYQKEEHSDHAFIKIGKYFVDGYGICLRNTMYKRWKYEERLPQVFIKPFNPKTEPIHSNGEEPFYIEMENIYKLVKMLEEQFDKKKVLSLLLND